MADGHALDGCRKPLVDAHVYTRVCTQVYAYVYAHVYAHVRTHGPWWCLVTIRRWWLRFGGGRAGVDDLGTCLYTCLHAPPWHVAGMHLPQKELGTGAKGVLGLRGC